MMNFPLAALLVASALAQDALPNIDYLGAGYNIFLGNPRCTDGIDPGFVDTGKVLQLNYDDGRMTDDQRYIIPDHTRAKGAAVCESEFESEEIYGAKSYFDSLSVDAKTDFGGFGASFSASVDYQSVSSGTSSNGNMFQEMKATCSVYEVSTEQFDTPQATEDFTKGIESLPESFDGSEQQFWDFIKVFGTHVMIAMEMGGRAGHRLEFTQEAWTSFQSSGTDVAMAAKYSGIISAGVELETDEETSLAKEFSDQSVSDNKYNVGGKYSTNTDEWTESVRTEPMPIKYTLTRLDEILTTAYMPSSDESVLSSRQEALRAAIDGYCELKLLADGALSSCDGPPDDPTMFVSTSQEDAVWSTDNNNGHITGLKECDRNQYVTRMYWRYQDNHGLIDLRFTCSDDSEYVLVGTDAGWDDRELSCDGGFSKAVGMYQDNYGIVNVKAFCLHDDTEQDSNDNFGGDGSKDWQDGRTECPNYAPVIVGFELNYQDGPGLVNFRVTCSNAVTGHFVI